MGIGLYSKILGVSFVAILAGVWGMAAWLLPVDGDLARVGGYAENEFGVREPQVIFEKNYFKLANTIEDYDKAYDVVVLGDSFSVDQAARLFGWQNFFIKRTGLSMIVFDTRRYWPVEIYDSPQFKKHPPKVFVFETVERYLHERVAYFSKIAPPPGCAGMKAALFDGGTPPTIDVHESVPNSAADFDPDHVLGHFGAIVQRRLGLNTQVVEVPLAKRGLFSSRNDSDMLVYFDEFKKQTLSEKDFSDLRAGADVFRRIVEGNGYTRFVMIVAPDKTSTYGPYLRDSAHRTANLVAELAKEPSLPVPRTDVVFSEVIASGKKDVYLPSDSHWGSIGHRVFADALADHLGAPRN